MRIATILLLLCWSPTCLAWMPSAPPPRVSVSQAMVASQEQEVVAPSSALGLTLEELTDALGGKGRALSCWECFRNGVDPMWYYFGSSEEEPGGDSVGGWSREQLKYLQGPALGNNAKRRLEILPSIESDIAQMTHKVTSKDGTTKLLLKLADGLQVETVIIPWSDRQRSTLCISSQVGCRQGCTFCATGRMGILRSLTRDEILAQVYWANKICRLEHDGIFPIDNIVFMGMGEPADNVKHVVPAAKALVHANMFQLASRRVTISTVGPTPACFAELAEAPVVLAWSVHGSRDVVRRALVPTTKYTMKELRAGLLEALEGRSLALQSTMLEVTLLRGVNDSHEDAMDLIDFCRPIEEKSPKVVVNLIPWNNIGADSGVASSFEQPTVEQVMAFQKTLTENGVRCYIRTTRGDDESAACGQLATNKKRKQPKP